MSSDAGPAPDDDIPPMMGTVESEVHQLLGLFDSPAFARRGQDVERATLRLLGRCRATRQEYLEMTLLRLRQWAAVSAGPDDWSDTFDAPISPLWDLADAPEPPSWAGVPATPRRRRAAARDLIASVSRFNRRWSDFLGGLDLAPLNRRIDGYNRYYLVEKECVLGSARLARRLFTPLPTLTLDDLRSRFPTLPEPLVR